MLASVRCIWKPLEGYFMAFEYLYGEYKIDVRGNFDK
jgi:hypothetical protein